MTHPMPDAQDRALLKLRGVSHQYLSESGQTVAALASVDLEITRGEVVCIVGPSGCGKTTILNLLAGFITPTEGAVTFRGKPIVGPGAERGVVFQQPNLLPWYTVAENVALGLRIRGIPQAVRQADAARNLELVGLADFLHAKPYELSGGMQQRAQIARALTTDSEVILMDEPFGALDALTREALQADLLEIQRSHRKTVVFITHSVEEAIFLGDRVLVMSPRPGHILLDQPVKLSEAAGRLLGPEMEAMPEFIAIRERISTAIAGTHITQ